MKAERERLQSEVNHLRSGGDEAVRLLNERIADLGAHLSDAKQLLRRQEAALVLAALKDATWLKIVRTRLMPKQPSRVPFHNAKEIALRGYHTAGTPQAPTLTSVTWSALPNSENGVHRGYRGGLVFNGSDFAPGAQIGTRSTYEGQTSEYWRNPNIYFGDYMEVSTNEDPDETPLGYRHTQFAVRNPGGHASAWVPFTYTYDEPKLTTIMNNAVQRGAAELSTRPTQAIEPLRKAMVFARHLLGDDASRYRELKEQWQEALRLSALSKLRFHEGDRVRVRSGEHAGSVGTVSNVLLAHANATALC